MKKFLILIVSLLLLPGAWASDFKEGKHYSVLATPMTAKPVVEEFFSFYCPHCAQFAPVVNQLKAALPDGVELKKYHVSFMGGAMGREMQLAFAAAQRLNIEAKVEASLFELIHTKKVQVASRKDIKMVFKHHGIAEADYDATVASFELSTQIESWDQKMLAYKLTGVPAIVVNGKYTVNSGSIKTINEFNALVNYLVNLK